MSFNDLSKSNCGSSEMFDQDTEDAFAPYELSSVPKSVENDDKRPKRRRISKACMQCRARKTKCNGEEPVCETCRIQGLECSYTKSRRRGLPAGYVLQLERSIHQYEQLLGLFISSVDNAPSQLDKLIDDLNAISLREKSQNPEKSTLNKYEKVWQSSALNKKLKSSLDDVTSTGSVPVDASAGDEPLGSPTGNADPFDKPEQTPDFSSSALGLASLSKLPSQPMPMPSAVWNRPSLNAPSVSPIASVGSIGSSVASPITSVPASASATFPSMKIGNCQIYVGSSSGLKHITNIGCYCIQTSHNNKIAFEWLHSIPLTRRLTLIDYYFSFVHCWLPMIDKVDIIRLAYSSDPFTSRNSGMLLCSVLLTAGYVSGEPEPSDFLEWASQLMSPLRETSYSLNFIQTLILVSILLVGKGFLSDSWNAIGLATRISYDLGIHVHNDTISEFSRRTWYACCVVETLLAARLGRVPHTSERDFDIDPLNEDSWEEWDLIKPYAKFKINTEEDTSYKPRLALYDGATHTREWPAQPARSISVFNTLFKLIRLLNGYIGHINQPGFAEMDRIHNSMFNNDTASRLHSWRRNLVEHCSLSTFLSKTMEPLPPHIVNLHLAFVTTAEIFHMNSHLEKSLLDLYLPQHSIPTVVCQLFSNYLSSFNPSTASPFFPYFSSIALEQSFNNLNGKPEDKFVTDSLYHYTQKYSEAWNGLFIGKDYFLQRSEQLNATNAKNASSTGFVYTEYDQQHPSASHSKSGNQLDSINGNSHYLANMNISSNSIPNADDRFVSPADNNVFFFC